MRDGVTLGGMIKDRTLFAADGLILLLVPITAMYLRTESSAAIENLAVPLAVYTITMLFFKMVMFFSLGLYSHHWAYESSEGLQILFQALFYAFISEQLIAFGVLLPFGLLPADFPHAIPLIGAFVTTTCIAGTRLSLRLAFSMAHQSPAPTESRSALIVGAGAAGTMILKELQANAQLGLAPIAFVDDDPAKVGTRIHGVPVIGKLHELPVILQNRGIEQVIVAMPTAQGKVVRQVVATCRDAGVRSDTVPGVFDVLRWSARVNHRLMDLAISGIGILVLAPVFLFVSAIIVLTSPGPILFSQTRVGLRGRPFRVHKFRSMVPDAEALGTSVTTTKDQRITPIGRFLRRTKLDELPQLWNVFIGEMSLVGPRPDVPEIVATYNSEMLRVLDIRPGITSNATFHLRHEEALLALSPVPDEVYELVVVPFKVALAMEHVDRDSFFFDFGVLARTVWALTGGRRQNEPPDWILELIKNDIRQFTIVPDWKRNTTAWSNWHRYRKLLHGHEQPADVHAYINDGKVLGTTNLQLLDPKRRSSQARTETGT